MDGKSIQALRGNFAQLFASMKLVKFIELSNASNYLGEELSLVNGHYIERIKLEVPQRKSFRR